MGGEEEKLIWPGEEEIQLRQLSLFRTDESLLQNLVFFLSDLSLGERKANIGPTFCVSDSDLVRWPAVVGTELAEVSVFLLFSDWKAETRQVRGPGQVGLCPERVTRGLRWRSLTSSGGSL